ncbi:hypothetical protein BT69DRAFT_1319077 [Atractiella rhizophila]|nr:hypothetical protein BT69DRAFT_1319077 [Atractiella rhizophila]
MADPESIHNHSKLVKQLGTTFSVIGSDLKRWDEAWKAFYLVTPFSTCVQTHQVLTLFHLCLNTWREVRSDGEGIAAGFADWEDIRDWDNESHHMWAKSVLFQLHGLLVAAKSQFHLATRMSSLQTELLHNCHDHLRFVNNASNLRFWRRPARLCKRREFVITSCSRGLIEFWKEVKAHLQSLRAGRLQLQRSLLLVLTVAWLDCRDVYGDNVPHHFLQGYTLKLSVDFLQRSPKFRRRPSASPIYLYQTEDPPVPPRPLPSDSELYAMALSDVLMLYNQELKFIVLSVKWVNATVESRWVVSPQEVQLIQEDLRFVLFLMFHDYESFLNDFLTAFEKILLKENPMDEKARDTLSKLNHSFLRISLMLSSVAVFLEPTSELLSHSISCQLERAESSTHGLAAVLIWIKLKWYQFCASVHEMVQSAENGDAGSSHIQKIFQENVEALRIQVGDLVAFRENFEKDADFLRGEYNPTAHVNWSLMRPEIRRVRRW